jgi:hypothetical protein
LIKEGHLQSPLANGLVTHLKDVIHHITKAAHIHHIVLRMALATTITVMHHTQHMGTLDYSLVVTRDILDIQVIRSPIDTM